jgi:Xaa-Pro aminopeptidase
MIKTERIEKLQESLRGANMSGALLSNSRDVFYYTGTAQPSCLFVSPQDYLLFVRAGIDFARKEVTLPQEKIREERSLEKVLQEVSARLEKTGTIGTELDLIPARNFLELRRIFRGLEITDISPMVLKQRGTKDLSEIAAIKRACAVIHKGHERVLTVLRKGITELELAAAVEDAHRLGGHEGVFFIRQPDFFMGRGPLASGRNLYQNSGVVYTITGTGLSASVPAGPSRREIKKGDLVVVDIPVHSEGYHADQTRTYVLGKATKEAGTLFSSLKEIADRLIGSIRPGMRCSDVYQMALSLAEKLGVGKQFMNFGGGQKSKIIGHGIGIELNEPPILSALERLEIPENCVIALDMHLMDEKHGVVKLEDMVLSGEKKNELLTITPRELFEIE